MGTINHQALEQLQYPSRAELAHVIEFMGIAADTVSPIP